MPVATRKQIKDSVLSTTKQLDAQIGDLVEDFINITLQEIGNPGWAFKPEKHHLWSWLKRKTTFSATSEDTVLERDVDKIAFMRQLDSPTKIDYVPDDIFYRELPKPTETGNPRIYRLWEIDGVSTRLAAADTIDVVSSSNSDGSSYEIIVTGYVSGRLRTEAMTLNGTTKVNGTVSFDARELFISKSNLTNGYLTITEHSGGTTLLVLGKEEISPRFKVVSLWPIPTSTTVYMEYYKKIKELNNDSEMPEFDPKWHHVVRVGTLAKVYQYLGRVNDLAATQLIYEKLVRSMVAEDATTPDIIEHLRSRELTQHAGVRLHLSEDVIA